MNIEKLQASIKGQFLDLKFHSPITVVVGDNGSGKTSIPIAINLALRGFEPSIARSDSKTNNKAHRKLAGPDGVLYADLAIVGDSSGDEPERWSYRLTAKGRSHQPARELHETEVRILTPERFFDATPAERLDYALGVASIDEEKHRTFIGNILKHLAPSATDDAKPGAGIVETLDAMTAHLKREAKATKEDLSAINAEISNLEEAVAETDQRLAGLVTGGNDINLDEQRARLKELTDLASRRQALEEQAARAKMRLESLGDQPATKENVVDLEKALAEAEFHRDSQTQFYAKLRAEREEKNHDMKAFASLRESVASGRCPTCNQTVPGNPEKEAEFAKKSNALLVDIGKLSAQMQEIWPTVREAEANVSALRKKLSDLHRHGQALAAREEAQRNLNEAVELVAGIPETVDQERAALQARLAAAEGLHRTTEKLNERKATAQASLESKNVELGQVNEKALNCKLWLKQIKERKERIVKESFSELFEAGAEALGGVLPWFRIEADLDGNLGYWRGETWVSWRAWSGSEKLVAYCMLAVSIAAKSKGFRLVVIDELGRFSHHNQLSLIEALNDAWSDDVIDQAILLAPEIDGDVFPAEKIELEARK